MRLQFPQNQNCTIFFIRVNRQLFKTSFKTALTIAYRAMPIQRLELPGWLKVINYYSTEMQYLVLVLVH